MISFFSRILCLFLSFSFEEIISVLPYSVENYHCVENAGSNYYIFEWPISEGTEKNVEDFLGTFSFQGERSIIQDKSYFISLLGVTKSQSYSYIEKA